MSGFPTRPSRSAFGGTPVDVAPVKDPTRYQAADLGDLMYWQIAGCSQVVDGAWARIDFTGPAALAVVASGESWDPNEAGALPVPTRNGVGDYELAYAANYNDKDGNAVTTSFRAAKAYPQTASHYNAVANVKADGRTIEINIYDIVGAAAVDCDVLVEVI